MTSFDFSDEELNAILTYIKDESTKEVQVVVADVTDEPPSNVKLSIIGGLSMDFQEVPS